MFLSTQLTQADSNVFAQFGSLTSKSSVFKTPTIHSSKTRNYLFSDGTNFGRIRSSQLRSDSSGGTPQNRERGTRPLTAQNWNPQNWRKNLSINVKEEVLEQGLRDYLGISQPFRPKTSDLKENSHYIPQRTGTSSSNKRMAPMGISSVKSVKSVKSFNRIPSSLDVEGLLRRDLMCQTEEVDVEDFGDDKTQHKFLHVKFIKAPSKEFLKLLKLSNYDVTLVPSDSRRIILEAIMRDYFLNLIPETSDFLICKNTQNHVYTIVFTGRLVPTCKACSSVARFEVSRDLGFQVLCNSQYCSIKSLYQSRLSDKTRECLWPATARPDVEHSLPIHDISRPIISKIIQSGKYKTTDFSRVMSDVNRPGSQEVNKRPNTTANIMRNIGSASRINRVVIRTSFNEKSMPGDGNRPNTVQGLRRPTVLRPGTAGSASASLDIKDFKGVSVLKEFDDEGLFAKDKEEIGMIEHVSEEMSGDEDDRKVVEELKISKQTIRKSGLMRIESDKKRGINKKEEGYMVKPVPKKNFFGNNDNSGKLDNSMEDIHNMVNILSK